MPLHDNEHPHTWKFLVALTLFMSMFAYYPRVFMPSWARTEGSSGTSFGDEYIVVRRDSGNPFIATKRDEDYWHTWQSQCWARLKPTTFCTTINVDCRQPGACVINTAFLPALHTIKPNEYVQFEVWLAPPDLKPCHPLTCAYTQSE